MKCLFDKAERDLFEYFQMLEQTEIINTARILKAFSKYEVAQRHFAPSTGYGYNDTGRETLESIYAEIFQTESALVRPHIASGTHAISLCLFGLAIPGDHILSVTGKPYDTLDQVLGLNGLLTGSLKEMNVDFSYVNLKPDGQVDIKAVIAAIQPNTRILMLQRSCGYEWRPSILPEDMQSIFEYVKKNHSNCITMVDNCYGEFVCDCEPSHLGADICVGSLIKNPGGGLAPTGGYIVGSQEAVNRISYRLTAPGIGKEIGSYAGSYLPFYQGLFLAPHTVTQALKTAALAGAVFEKLQIPTMPASQSKRSDIIQAACLQKKEKLITFCRNIQQNSPVDSMVCPEPWDMPGYSCDIIMASGSFIAGSSLELSADAPLKEPYNLFIQGGLTYAHGKLALMSAMESIMAL